MKSQTISITIFASLLAIVVLVWTVGGSVQGEVRWFFQRYSEQADTNDGASQADHDWKQGINAITGLRPARIGRHLGPQRQTHLEQLQEDHQYHDYRFLELRKAALGYHIWSTQYKYYACIIPKVGCTSWLHFLRDIQLPANITRAYKSSPYKRDSLPDYGLFFRNSAFSAPRDLHAAEAVINDPSFFRFAVVRHPWQRLLSAFRSKYEHFCKRDRMCLVSEFRVLHLDVSDRDSPVSFDEFVHALALQNPTDIDQHFRPATLLCDFGRIPYDFIMDIESQADADVISRRLHWPRPFRVLPVADADAASSKYKAKLYSDGSVEHREAYPPQPCSYDTVATAEWLYGEDARFFGYDFHDAYFACSQFGLSSVPDRHASSQGT